jgi:hypothetical protein
MNSRRLIQPPLRSRQQFITWAAVLCVTDPIPGFSIAPARKRCTSDSIERTGNQLCITDETELGKGAESVKFKDNLAEIDSP